jgi:hypothetical protein
MSPFRNAMGLIYCKQSEWDFGKARSKLFVSEALGCYVKEPDAIFLKFLVELARFFCRKGGIESGRRDSFGD